MGREGHVLERDVLFTPEVPDAPLDGGWLGQRHVDSALFRVEELSAAAARNSATPRDVSADPSSGLIVVEALLARSGSEEATGIEPPTALEGRSTEPSPSITNEAWLPRMLIIAAILSLVSVAGALIAVS